MDTNLKRLPTKYRLLVPFRQNIAALFPDAPRRGDDLVIPHGLAETIILRRHGIQVPAPILNQYTYTGHTPFHVQRVTCEMLTTNQRAYVLSTMGTGKTSCPLWAFDFLKQQGHATKMLIDAPLSTLDFVWMKEMLEVASPYKAVVVHGPRHKRLKLLDTDADIYIINHDGLATVYDALTERHDIDVITIDELASFRNKNERTKLLTQYVNGDGKKWAGMKWVWGMTGSPAPHEPTDVYHQAKIVTPWTVPKYYTPFRDQLMYRVSEFRWLPQAGSAEKAYAALQPSVRFTLEDVSELPPYVSRRQKIKLGQKQRDTYETIRKDAFALLNSGETISAANQGVILSKLLQISLGYVYTSDGRTVALDNKPTLDAIIELLEQAQNPVLFACSFKHALRGFREHIAQAGKGDPRWDVPMVSGDTPMRERGLIFSAFQEGKYAALVCHPQCVAHGLTLTAADTVVWLGPIASLEIYSQFNARIRRSGQTKRQQFIHFERTPAETKLYKLLEQRDDIQHRITSLFEEELT